MGNFDEAILAAMQLDDASDKFDDTKTPAQKKRDSGRVKNERQLTRPALPVDVIDPDIGSKDGSVIDPQELVKRHYDSGNTLKRRQEEFELMMERDGTLNGVPTLGGRPSVKSGKA